MLTARFSQYSQYLLRAPHTFLPRMCALFQLTSRGRKWHKDGVSFFVCYLNPFRHWVATAKYVFSCDATAHQGIRDTVNRTPKAGQQATPQRTVKSMVKFQDLSPVATPAPASQPPSTPAPRLAMGPRL